MKIRILGEYAPYPAPDGATAGYLVDTGTGRFLIDCGSGVLSELLKHISLQELQGVIITHYHADHVADLGVLQYAIMVARKTGSRVDPLPIYANQEPPNKFQDVTYRSDVQAIPLNAGSVIQLCGARLTFTETVHSSSCLAVSVEQDGKKFVFSADTGPSPFLEQFAQNADLFICEASWLQKDQGPASVGHLTALQAGEMAQKANVKKLCLTHIYPGYDREELRREAAEVFKREIIVAEKGMVLEV
ncbi:MBL fold metallo-hydrolase [Effusibacillus consociatus]|uniref:MBL fold metallo-hydrolase n=1 Tax=Effusibacillus consociatus TaxID=1117041 RepID=A0ABV9PZA7_9BACL